ncbi:MAG: hypothetical protein GTO24_11555 [candidate division Zixibacteria bacterium]|nr:hypothetical protein [candidate division Zixibacteria bacterium]
MRRDSPCGCPLFCPDRDKPCPYSIADANKAGLNALPCQYDFNNCFTGREFIPP